ncbi:MAG TPA: acyl-CoA reductase [Saprospiraceae bacterium]|nr:acyl-CoA reductase [Saprospiraceae bacterium]HNT19309.1 acyl-CoA reductase [Saprospiraceae bacterium]
MDLNERIRLMASLGRMLREYPESLRDAIREASQQNKWFDEMNIRLALSNIADHYLDEKKLSAWIQSYALNEPVPKTVGIVMAGNLPLVGFHDLLCVFITGHRSLVKLSQKDQVLWPAIRELLIREDQAAADYFMIADRLKGLDAVIATGSDNSARYFHYYFDRYPHIIRKNRVGVAVIFGGESQDILAAIGRDVFSYYGLGCRNVSSLLVPAGYDFSSLLKSWEPFSELLDHHAYRNNFDYNRTLFIMNNIPFLESRSALLLEHPDLVSRIACLHYQYYDSPEQVAGKLNAVKDKIQVVVSAQPIPGLATILPGEAQSPRLEDYADEVDTIKFLARL